jgi:putative methionine-R-sulfoxide reductase with GAF domain
MNNSFSQPLAQTPPQGRNAVRLALTFMVAAFLATLVFGYVAVQNGSWQAYAVVAGFVGFFIFEAFVIRSAQRSQFNIAGYLLIAAVCYIVLVMVTFMAGIGLGLSIALAMVIIEIVFDTLSGKQATRTRLVGLTFAVSMLFLDYFAPWSRPLFPAVQVAIPTIAAGTVISIGLLMLGRLVTWRNLKLAQKLLISFSALAFITLILGVVSYLGSNNAENSYENALANGQKMQSTTLLLANRVELMHEWQNEFLNSWQEEGFQTARANYIVPLLKDLVILRENITELSSFAPVVGNDLGADAQTQFEADITLMNEQTKTYEQNLFLMLQLVQLRGFQDTGLEGQFRVAVQNIEAQVYEREGLDNLVITTLQIRRREKDYLLRGEQQYIDNVHQLVRELKQEIAVSELLDASEKTEISALADQYVVSFDKLVEKDSELTVSIEELDEAEDAFTPITDRLVSTGQQLSELEVANAQSTRTTSNLILFVAILASLIIAVFLAITLARQISQPVTLLTSAAQELQSGNYDLQTDITSLDEIGILASTFNGMAKQIKQALATVAQRAAELQTVAEVSASTSTVLETDKLLWNVSNLTKERFGLYHAHIYLMNNAGDTLVLAAGAGEPGQKMVAEGRSIPLDREQSLVARSARERKGVIVNDVRTAPDFLPNPLLPETRSELAVPMIVNDQVVGVFDIQSDQVDRFTQENADIQTTMAAQIAIAVQNARSYSEVQARAEREALIASIGQKIDGTSTVENALQVAVRELGRALSQEARIVLKSSDNSIQN